jgi:nucleoside diphosphate kinase
MSYILTIIKPYHINYSEEIFDKFKEIGNLKTNIAKIKPSLITWQEHYKEHQGRKNAQGEDYFTIMTEDFAKKQITLGVFEGNYEEFNLLKKEIRNKYQGNYIKHRNALHTSDSFDSANKEIIVWEKNIETILLNNDFKEYFHFLQNFKTNPKY